MPIVTVLEPGMPIRKVGKNLSMGGYGLILGLLPSMLLSFDVVSPSSRM